MSVREWIGAMSVVLLAGFGTGCVVVAGGSRQPYETCGAGDTCTGGTACVSANSTTDGFVGTFCTTGCNPSNPVCPTGPGGALAVCVPDNGGSPTSGQCYAGCSAGCPFDETCSSSAAGGATFCVP
jgi:hypothetical protein